MKQKHSKCKGPKWPAFIVHKLCTFLLTFVMQLRLGTLILIAYTGPHYQAFSLALFLFISLLVPLYYLFSHSLRSVVQAFNYGL